MVELAKIVALATILSVQVSANDAVASNLAKVFKTPEELNKLAPQERSIMPSEIGSPQHMEAGSKALANAQVMVKFTENQNEKVAPRLPQRQQVQMAMAYPNSMPVVYPNAMAAYPYQVYGYPGRNLAQKAKYREEDDETELDDLDDDEDEDEDDGDLDDDDVDLGDEDEEEQEDVDRQSYNPNTDVEKIVLTDKQIIRAVKSNLEKTGKVQWQETGVFDSFGAIKKKKFQLIVYFYYKQCKKLTIDEIRKIAIKEMDKEMLKMVAEIVKYITKNGWEQYVKENEEITNVVETAKKIILEVFIKLPPREPLQCSTTTVCPPRDKTTCKCGPVQTTPSKCDTTPKASC